MKFKFIIGYFILFSTSAFSQKVLDYKLFDYWDNSQWNLSAKESYSNDHNDSVVEKLYQFWDARLGKYNNSSRTTKVFNSHGQKIKDDLDYWRNDSIGWENSSKFEYYYNYNRQIDSVILFVWEFGKWRPSNKSIYGYNSNQTLNYIDDYNWDYFFHHWYTEPYRYSLYYDNIGNLIKTEGNQFKNYYIYNNLNQLDSSYREEQYYTLFRLSSSVKYQYNNIGMVSKKNEIEWDKHLFIKSGVNIDRYDYNEDSLLIQTTREELNFYPSTYSRKLRTRYFYKESLNNIPFNGSLFIYPQPATTTLNFVNNVNGISYKIFTLLGSQVKSGNLHSGVNSLDVLGLSRGTYALRIYSPNKVYTEKILISP